MSGHRVHLFPAKHRKGIAFSPCGRNLLLRDRAGRRLLSTMSEDFVTCLRCKAKTERGGQG